MADDKPDSDRRMDKAKEQADSEFPTGACITGAIIGGSIMGTASAFSGNPIPGVLIGGGLGCAGLSYAYIKGKEGLNQISEIAHDANEKIHDQLEKDYGLKRNKSNGR